MANATQDLVRLTGTVIELHPKSNANWSRARIQTVDGQRSWVTAKFQIEEGETFDANCTYNDKYKSYDAVSLVDAGDGKVSNDVVVLKLVEILDGVGAVKARRLSEKFPELYEALLESPERIADACGASLEDVKAVAAGLEGERSQLSRVTTLISRGFPHHLAKRIAKSDQQYTTALRSPYDAIRLVDGLGWLIADEIGRKQGIKVDDPSRIVAGVEYHYGEKVTKDGHTIIHEDELLKPDALPSLLGVPKATIFEYVEKTLIPRGDGWYTSARHLKNATIISEFFCP